MKGCACWPPCSCSCGRRWPPARISPPLDVGSSSSCAGWRRSRAELRCRTRCRRRTSRSVDAHGCMNLCLEQGSRSSVQSHSSLNALQKAADLLFACLCSRAVRGALGALDGPQGPVHSKVKRGNGYQARRQRFMSALHRKCLVRGAGWRKGLQLRQKRLVGNERLCAHRACTLSKQLGGDQLSNSPLHHSVCRWRAA